MILLSNDGSPASRSTDFGVRYQDGILTLEYIASDSDLFCPYTRNNEPLYEGCVVEFFLAEKGDRGSYLEFEFSPCGAIFCGRIIYDGSPHLTLLDTDSVIDCSIDTTSDGYKVRANISVDFDIDAALFNAYRIERKDSSSPYELFALFPTKCATFHKPEFMQPLKDYLE